MDIHKPKPWHSFREFLKEYLIIVVGVLTALAAEQAVEKVREHRATAEARAAVRSEIAADLGWMQNHRETQDACVERRLDELKALITAAREGRPYQPAKWVGRVLNEPVSSRRWTAASQSGRLSLLSSEEQAAYASTYFVIESYAAIEEQSQGTWATLRSLEGMKTIPPAMLWGFTEALAQARIQSYRTRRTTARALQSASVLGIRPTRPGHSPTDVKVQPACVPIDTERAAAIAMIGNPQGEP